MTDATMDSPPVSGPPPGAPSGGEGGYSKERVSAWFSRALPDFTNPVLVKEVRQAQRGKVFSVTLIVTLILAFFGATAAALQIERDYFSGSPGQEFFTSVYSFFNIAVLVVVPFQAFVSMGAEHDDNTFEMLVLSNLKPRQIVMGKIAAALTQGLMFGLTFLPFVVTAFLLRGVDLTVLLLILGLTAFGSAVMTTFAVMLSAIVRKRLLRVLTMVALAGILFGLVPMSLAVCYEWFRSPELFGEPAFYAVLTQSVLFTTVAMALFFAIACNMLAHEEENRSTNIRVAVTLLCLITAGAAAYNVTAFSMGAGMPREVVHALGVAGLFTLTVFCIFFVLEPDRLGRRVEPSIPRNKLVALAVSPWLPGGNRGVLFAGLHISLFALLIIVIAIPGSSYRFMGTVSAARGPLFPGGWAVLAAALYCLLYALAPAVFLRRLQGTPGKRNAARLIALSMPLLTMFIPTIFGLFIDDRDMQEFKHVGNPGWLIDKSWGSHGFRPMAAAFFVAGAVALLGALSLSRVVRGFGEVLTASRANVQRRRDTRTAA